jgi:predicted aspartyl protease
LKTQWPSWPQKIYPESTGKRLRCLAGPVTSALPKERAVAVNGKRILLASLLGTSLINPGASAAGKPTSKTPNADSDLMQRSSIPVNVYNGYLVVAAGQIGGQKENFVIDTGTAPSILSARLAKKMGLQVTTTTLVAVGRSLDTGTTILPELHFGPIHVTNLPVNVMDLSALENSLGMRIAGLIGMDVLGVTSFQLDYQKNELSFGTVSEEGIAVHYDHMSGLALAEATLQGRHVRLIVDTGSDLVVVYGESWCPSESAPRVVSTMQSGTSVGDQVGVRQIAKPELELGGEQFRDLRTYYVPSASAKGYDGFFGVRALHLRGISFDRATQTMYLLN